jgi:hypothetical protein
LPLHGVPARSGVTNHWPVVEKPPARFFWGQVFWQCAHCQAMVLGHAGLMFSRMGHGACLRRPIGSHYD